MNTKFLDSRRSIVTRLKLNDLSGSGRRVVDFRTISGLVRHVSDRLQASVGKEDLVLAAHAVSRTLLLVRLLVAAEIVDRVTEAACLAAPRLSNFIISILFTEFNVALP